MDFDQGDIDNNIDKRQEKPQEKKEATDNDKLFGHLAYLHELNESLTDYKQVEEEGPGRYSLSGLEGQKPQDQPNISKLPAFGGKQPLDHSDNKSQNSANSNENEGAFDGLAKK
jgi:hypothetical protein